MGRPPRLRARPRRVLPGHRPPPLVTRRVLPGQGQDALVAGRQPHRRAHHRGVRQHGCRAGRSREHGVWGVSGRGCRGVGDPCGGVGEVACAEAGGGGL